MRSIRNRKKMVRGIGVNDADYQTQVYEVVNGKRVCTWRCPFYTAWSGVLRRVSTYKTKPKICEDWLVFSRFKAWMEKQDWEGLELDKDILSKGEPIYSPSTCCFIPHKLNSLLKDNKVYTESYPLGVHLRSDSRGTKLFTMSVERFSTGSDKIGKIVKRFYTEADAHSAWQVEKAVQIEYAVEWYAKQSYFRTDVAEALTNKVWRLRLQNSLGEVTSKF